MFNVRLKCSLSLFLLVFSVTSCAANKSSTPESVGLSAARLANIVPVMQNYVDAKKLNGTVTLVARKGKVAHLATTGYLDLEQTIPMQTDSIFRIYSMSKPITAVAALILWEQGQFHLSDPVAKYLPELADLKVYVSGSGDSMQLEDAKQAITILDLFRHTAGFSYGFTNSEVDRLYRNSELLSGKVSRQNILTEIAKLPLAYQPGATWHYGISTDVLGLLVEKISQQSLADFMQTHIFNPLQMVDTGFYVPDAKLARFSKLYTIDKQGKTVLMANEPLGDFKHLPEVQSGGGGLVSTIGDYYRFAQMLLNGGELDGQRILGRKTVEYMRSNHLPANLSSFEPSAPGEGFGLAMSVTIDTRPALYLGSVGDYGWGGMASTFFRIDPLEDMIIISMTQLIPSGFYPYQNDFRNLSYQALID
jgi:CubicO group peptidase (beta-lactamase class C family)